ncbi:MAG: hypothetical protein AB7F75_05145 [Planctomycetota bacterium]
MHRSFFAVAFVFISGIGCSFNSIAQEQSNQNDKDATNNGQPGLNGDRSPQLSRDDIYKIIYQSIATSNIEEVNISSRITNKFDGEQYRLRFEIKAIKYVEMFRLIHMLNDVCEKCDQIEILPIENVTPMKKDGQIIYSNEGKIIYEIPSIALLVLK